MKEVELAVDDYELAKEFMLQTGLVVKSEQQSRREIWKLGKAEIMLDTWPWIDPVVEVEGPNEGDVKQVCIDLGLDWTQAMFDSIDAVYLQSFDTTRREVCTIPWVFGPVPETLESKRIN